MRISPGWAQLRPLVALGLRAASQHSSGLEPLPSVACGLLTENSGKCGRPTPGWYWTYKHESGTVQGLFPPGFLLLVIPHRPPFHDIWWD